MTMITQSLKFPILVGLMGLFLLVSCNKADDNPGNPSTVENNVQSGTWRITKFIDSGKDETYYFTGYNFTFKSSGVVNANNGSKNYDGTWSITSSSSKNDLDFNLYFNLSNEFEELNDDWDFITQSATKIELIDVSGGNGGTDYLTFERN
jgi:hypothetical protein